MPLGRLLLISVTSASTSNPVASLNQATIAASDPVLGIVKRKPACGVICSPSSSVYVKHDLNVHAELREK